jgi:hypothetical protein
MNDPRELSTIKTLRANVSEPEAFSEFRSTRLSSIVWRFGNGPLRKIAPVHLPFSLYCLQYELRRTCHRKFLAMDQVEGVLDLVEFPEALSSTDLLTIETRNKIAPTLSQGRAEFLLREKALRLVFQKGFFRLRKTQLEIQSVVKMFHIPYWLGFYGNDGSLHCRVLDAVRRRMEGPKVTQLFERWLAN